MRAPIEWINEFLSAKVTAEKASCALTMGGLEVERVEKTPIGDVLELGITPNRGDCLSIMGVARETAALNGVKFKIPALKKIKSEKKTSDFAKVSIRDKKACPRYSAMVIRGLKVGPSPEIVAKRLLACGIRPVNNVVDATNIIMLETGQPLHAFDLREIKGGSITVRRAGAAQKFKTLDGVERDLLPEDILICDLQRPVAIAGVMGGENSEVRADTTDVLLECAFFDPISIRKTSRRLGLSSESSRRFERGVDPNAIPYVLNRLATLVCELSGGVPAKESIDAYPQKILPKKIVLKQAEVKRILGVSVGAAEISKLLSKIQIACKTQGSSVVAFVPTFRPDIERPADLIEEVARLYGYGKITEELPVVRMSPVRRREHLIDEFVARSALMSCGFCEALLYGFTSPEKSAPFECACGSCVKVENPLSEDESVMRTSLLPGLLDAMKLNVSRQRKDLKLFSLQNVFKNCHDLTGSQCRRVSGLLCNRKSPRHWERSNENVDFYDAKGAVETLLQRLGLLQRTTFAVADDLAFMHPQKTARVSMGDKQVGFVGALHPSISAKWDADFDVYCFELDFGSLAEASKEITSRYFELSKFPSVERDIALVIPLEVSGGEVMSTIKSAAPKSLTDLSIFDVYAGKGIEPGKKSLALTLSFGLNDRTLTDDEVNSAQANIIAVLSDKFGAMLRG